jgi:hypothetical protein
LLFGSSAGVNAPPSSGQRSAPVSSISPGGAGVRPLLLAMKPRLTTTVPSPAIRAGDSTQ